MMKSKVGLWIDTVYRIHSLTRASTASLETINMIVTHVSDGKPILAVQDEDEMHAIIRAIKSSSEGDEFEEVSDMH